MPSQKYLRALALAAALPSTSALAEPAREAAPTELGAAWTSPEPRPSDLSLELGVFGGAFFPASDHELYDSTQSFQSAYRDAGPTMGLRLGFFLLPILGVEAEGGYAPVVNGRDETNHLYDARGHLVLRGPWQVSPFLLAGGGVIGVDGDRGGDMDGALHWGAGVSVFANHWLNFRVDGRHVISGAASPGEGNTSHFSVTAGLGVVLWRPDPAPEPLVETQPTEPTVEAAPPQIAAVEPEPEPEPVEVLPETAEPVVARRVLRVEPMSPVHFAFDSDQVPESFLPVLREVLVLVEAQDELDVLVVGHTDAVGTATYNQGLSERRAAAVARVLMAWGIAEERLRVRGDGERVPVAPNESAEGRAENRRTELTVVERRETLDDEPVEARATPEE